MSYFTWKKVDIQIKVEPRERVKGADSETKKKIIDELLAKKENSDRRYKQYYNDMKNMNAPYTDDEIKEEYKKFKNLTPEMLNAKYKEFTGT